MKAFWAIFFSFVVSFSIAAEDHEQPPINPPSKGQPIVIAPVQAPKPSIVDLIAVGDNIWAAERAIEWEGTDAGKKNLAKMRQTIAAEVAQGIRKQVAKANLLNPPNPAKIAQAEMEIMKKGEFSRFLEKRLFLELFDWPQVSVGNDQRIVGKAPVAMSDFTAEEKKRYDDSKKRSHQAAAIYQKLIAAELERK